MLRDGERVRGIPWRTALWAALGLVCLTFGLTYRVTAGLFPWQRPALGALTRLHGQPGFQNLERALSLIATRYVNAPDMSKVYAGAISGAVATLGDPYSAYLTPSSMAALAVNASGHYTGIGVRVQRTSAGQYQVAQVFAGGPAAKAGLRAGDVLRSIGGWSLQDASPAALATHLAGPEGSTVSVTVSRDGSDLTFRVVRGTITILTVGSRMLTQRIGYLDVSGFNDQTATEVHQALQTLRQYGMRSLVLDLRNNPGGVVHSAVGVASLFVPPGLVTYLRSRGGARVNYVARSGGPLGVPLAVLVNGQTASAAEVLAGAIQDDGTGLLIGTRTFGKGVVQAIFPLGNGAGLKLTIARYYTPLGRNLQGAGLTPGLTVPSPGDTAALGQLGQDPQLDAAVSYLRREMGAAA